MMVMLLAAGRGERMRPFTDHTPKPLLEIDGKSLIVWHIENLVRAGMSEIVINHAHLGALIEAALGDGSRYGAQIRYSSEGTALETAGGIAYALPLLLPPKGGAGGGTEGGREPFAVINSDIFCDYDFARLPERATALQANADTAHLVLVNNPPQHPNGDFGLADSRVTEPQSSALSPQPSILTFSGIGIYQPALFKDIPRGSRAPLAPLLRAQIALGKVSGEHHAGLWTDVGTPQRLAELRHELDSRVRSSHNAP